MLDIYSEFERLISALTERRNEYAVCGGLAMAIHGVPRTTIDIDVLINAESLEAVKEAAAELGYIIQASPMTFQKGQSRSGGFRNWTPTQGTC